MNTGTIDTPRGGNISIASLLIDQNGRLSATTTVRAGGSIQLKAGVDPTFSNGSAQRITAGKVSFGRGSQTTVLPEDSTETSTDAEAFEHSKIQVIAGAATMERGAEILAPAGDVGLQIAASVFDGSPNRFTMERGSRIDVSGTTSTEVAMERNQVSITLRKNELNSPLQRDGFLFGKTVNVDVREGSPIGSVDGYLKGVGRTATERSAVGGTVAVSSTDVTRTGEVVIRDGAVIDVSGGQVRYRGGWLDTTQLVGADGRVYDISEASPDLQYVAFAEQRFAQQTLYGPRWEAGYTDGMDAGSVSITTGTAVIDGRITGQTTPGARQRVRDQLPALGSLTLNLTGAVDVAFGAGGSGLPDGFGPGDALSKDLRDRLRLDPPGRRRRGRQDRDRDPGRRHRGAAGRHPAHRPGRRGRPAVAPCPLDPRGPEEHGDIVVAGAIETPSGTITLGGRNITLKSGARLAARGQWVNDRIDAQGNPYSGGSGPTGAALPDGGSISLGAAGDLTLSGGSLIDVSRRRLGRDRRVADQGPWRRRAADLRSLCRPGIRRHQRQQDRARRQHSGLRAGPWRVADPPHRPDLDRRRHGAGRGAGAGSRLPQPRRLQRRDAAGLSRRHRGARRGGDPGGTDAAAEPGLSAARRRQRRVRLRRPGAAARGSAPGRIADSDRPR